MDAIAPGPSPTNQPTEPTNKDGGGRKCNCEFLGRLTYVHEGVGFHLIRFHCRPGKELCVCWQLIKNNIPTIQFFLLCGGVLLSTLTILISVFTLCHLSKSNDIKSQCGWSSVQLAHRELANTVFTLDHLFDLVCSQSGKFSLALVEPPYATNLLCMYLQLATYIEP